MSGADCREVLSRVYEYLDGEMPEEDVQRIRDHLRSVIPAWWSTTCTWR
jgi:DNA phosphorothioation-dependent restriction protein DptG